MKAAVGDLVHNDLEDIAESAKKILGNASSASKTLAVVRKPAAGTITPPTKVKEDKKGMKVKKDKKVCGAWGSW